MGPDAEESLTHDDERRNDEDEVGGQIMEVQPVVEHETTDGWMEGKPQSVEEVVEENYPLMGFWGRDNLPHNGQPMCDIRGQVSGSAQLLDVSLRNGGSHPFASRSGHDWRRLRGRMWAWALELECAREDGHGGRRRGWKKVEPCPFIREAETMRPH